MSFYLMIAQTILALLLIFLIIIQPKGSGFGRSWKGNSNFARRGLELLVFKSTFVVTFLLVATSIIQLII